MPSQVRYSTAVLPVCIGDRSLTLFAPFAALIHDLDHQGVPNAVLMKEGSPLVEKYHSKSLAEQNSIDLAWGLLSEYPELLNTICGDEEGYCQFRQLVVNGVCATDIAGMGYSMICYENGYVFLLIIAFHFYFRQGIAGCSKGSLAGGL